MAFIRDFKVRFEGKQQSHSAKASEGGIVNQTIINNGVSSEIKEIIEKLKVNNELTSKALSNLDERVCKVERILENHNLKDKKEL